MFCHFLRDDVEKYNMSWHITDPLTGTAARTAGQYAQIRFLARLPERMLNVKVVVFHINEMRV